MSTVLAELPSRLAAGGDRPPVGGALAPQPSERERRGALRLALLAWPTLAVAAVLCLVTFLAGGGLNLGPMTSVEILLTVGCALAIAAALLLTPAARPAYGLCSVGLLLAFAALAALSVVWSVKPDESWQAASRLLAYSCGVRARGAARQSGSAALVGGARRGAAGERGGLRLRAADEGLPEPPRQRTGRSGHARCLREPYGYSERDQRLGKPRWARSRAPVARRAPSGAPAAERTRQPPDGDRAGDADACRLARGAGARSLGDRVVAVPRAAAPLGASAMVLIVGGLGAWSWALGFLAQRHVDFTDSATLATRHRGGPSARRAARG